MLEYGDALEGPGVGNSSLQIIVQPGRDDYPAGEFIARRGVSGTPTRALPINQLTPERAFSVAGGPRRYTAPVSQNYVDGTIPFPSARFITNPE